MVLTVISGVTSGGRGCEPAGDYYSPRTGGSITFTESVYYLPSSTVEQTLIVQEDSVLSWPPVPLPTDYWTRPISIENREWWEIGGNFPFTGKGGGPEWPADTNTYSTADYDFIPYVQAPNTAHIVWRRQGALAGIIGGQFGYRSYGPGEGGYAGQQQLLGWGSLDRVTLRPQPLYITGSVHPYLERVKQA